MKGIKPLLILCAFAVVLRIISFAGLVDWPQGIDGFLNGFIVGTLIGAALAWWAQRV